MKPLILLAQEAAAAAESTPLESFNRGLASIWGSIKGMWSWVTDSAWPALSGMNGRLLIATLLAGLGLWLMLPGATRMRKFVGGVMALAGAGIMISVLPIIGLQFESIVFWMLAGITVCAATATITSRSPVYSAIWFALMLLGVGGLFMINGAQFLGVATVAVYAGAIVVTFLFVLMLAEPQGHSFYDRISWGKLPSLAGCFAGAGLAAILIGAVAQTPLEELAVVTGDTRAILNEQHVANLGGRLFTTHIVAVQVAATLLLAALVGAVAMAAHGGARRPLQAVEGALSAGLPGDPGRHGRADGTDGKEGVVR